MIDIGNIFSEIELDLVNSLTKELSGDNWKRQRHRALLEFQKRNIAILNKYPVSEEAKRQLENAYLQAGYKTQADIQKMLASAKKTGTSFAVSDKRLLALVDQLQRDLDNAQTAAVRMMNDVFKETTAKAQVAMATNLYTLEECVDIATQDFLARGINCIQYANGARVNIASYADMAIRTSTRRATLIAEGAMRSDWGQNLVYVTQYGACSDTCLPWQGRVYWDDVYSKGEPQPDYPRLSEAISGGLFHPNCRHKSTSWYPGISKVPPIMDEEVVRRNSALQAEQRYNERQIRKYKRMEEGSLDPDNKAKYGTKVKQWQARQRQLIKDNNDVLRRDYSRERTRYIGLEKEFSQKPVVENFQGVIPKDSSFDSIKDLLLNGSTNPEISNSLLKNQLSEEEFAWIKQHGRDISDFQYRVKGEERVFNIDDLYSTQPTNKTSRLESNFNFIKDNPEQVPEIKVVKIQGKPVIADGNHRLLILKALGYTKVKVSYWNYN